MSEVRFAMEPCIWLSKAESRLELGEGAAAARAYEKAIALSPAADFELLQGLAGSLVVDGKPQQVRAQPSSATAGTRILSRTPIL